jgi:hypothetical protein
MVLLATATILCGLFASTIAPILAFVAARLIGVSDTLPLVSPLTSLTVGGPAALSIIPVALIITLAIAITYLVTEYFARRQKEVIARTWDCGATLTPRMEITGTGFSRSIITVYKGIVRPIKHVSVEYTEDTFRHFVRTRTVSLSSRDIYGAYIYEPAMRGVHTVSRLARKMHGGNLNVYLLYIFFTTILLLLIAFSI